MSENRVIGCGNRIPWHLPEDFKWFKQKTTGQVLLMGRRTFESIGRPLPNRTTLLLSRKGFVFSGVNTIADWRKHDWLHEEREVFVCGGAEIYSQLLPYCSDLYLTLVKKKVEGDTFFPAFEHRFEIITVLADTADFSILHYRQTRPEEIPHV